MSTPVVYNYGWPLSMKDRQNLTALLGDCEVREGARPAMLDYSQPLTPQLDTLVGHGLGASHVILPDIGFMAGYLAACLMGERAEADERLGLIITRPVEVPGVMPRNEPVALIYLYVEAG